VIPARTHSSSSSTLYLYLAGVTLRVLSKAAGPNVERLGVGTANSSLLSMLRGLGTVRYQLPRLDRSIARVFPRSVRDRERLESLALKHRTLLRYSPPLPRKVAASAVQINPLLFFRSRKSDLRSKRVLSLTRCERFSARETPTSKTKHGPPEKLENRRSWENLWTKTRLERKRNLYIIPITYPHRSL